jgi:hypothetical protein
MTANHYYVHIAKNSNTDAIKRVFALEETTEDTVFRISDGMGFSGDELNQLVTREIRSKMPEAADGQGPRVAEMTEMDVNLALGTTNFNTIGFPANGGIEESLSWFLFSGDIIGYLIVTPYAAIWRTRNGAVQRGWEQMIVNDDF